MSTTLASEPGLNNCLPFSLLTHKHTNLISGDMTEMMLIDPMDQLYTSINIIILKVHKKTKITELHLGVSTRGVNGSGHIILLFFLIRFEPGPIKFGSKNINPYLTRPDPTRRVTGRPDPTRVK
jgi:hypothetical protein